MYLSDIERLAIIVGCVSFLFVCFVIIVCKLCPCCWLHKHCLLHQKHEQQYQISAKPEKTKDYQSTGSLEPYALTHPQVGRWRHVATDSTSSDGEENYHIQIDRAGIMHNQDGGKISLDHYGSSSDTPLSDSDLDRSGSCLVKGEISFSVFYPDDDSESVGGSQQLHVWIRKVTNLIVRRRDKMKVCVKVQLLKKETNIDRFLKFFQFLDPEQQERNVEYETQTSLKPIHKSLEWPEHRRIPLPKDEIEDRCIRLVCCLYDQHTHYTQVGQVMTSLNDAILSQDLIIEKRMDPVRQESRGEILISLTYLPTAQKLVVIPAECRQLKLNETKYPSFIYIRVSLITHGSSAKYKTSSREAQSKLTWDDSMTFDVRQDQLNEVNLIVAVKQSISLPNRSKDFMIGKLVLGAQACPLKGQQQWNAMLINPRQPQSEWHTLW